MLEGSKLNSPMISSSAAELKPSLVKLLDGSLFNVPANDPVTRVACAVTGATANGMATVKSTAAVVREARTQGPVDVAMRLYDIQFRPLYRGICSAMKRTDKSPCVKHSWDQQHAACQFGFVR